MSVQNVVQESELASKDLSMAARVWGKIGLLSFGGPAAQIALMHDLIVERYKWISEKQYLNALSFCMLLPGPEAMQLATYIGWRIHGMLGGLLAGLLFVLPGALVILGMAIIYVTFGEQALVQALFLGIKASVLVIVIQSLIRVASRAIKTLQLRLLALLSFVAIFFFSIPFPIIIFLAAIFGYLTIEAGSVSSPPTAKVSIRLASLVKTVLLFLMIWWLPVLVMDYFLPTPILSDIGQFFSKLAVVTFGGAYAVLAYMAQAVVTDWQWLTAGEMMDGLGLAETTPGPLILVTEFVGFVAAYREGGLGLGIAGALVTLWVTFVPCFLWIFAGAPYVDWITAQPKLKGALDAISAAVVGVILNLSLWFALHVIFDAVHQTKLGVLDLWYPVLSSVNWLVVALVAVSALLMLMLKWNIIRAMICCVLLAGLYYFWS